MKSHLLEINEVIRQLESNPNGLTTDEATRRLELYGANRIEEHPPVSPWRIFFRQFADLMILILALAAVMAGWMEDLTDMIIILAIIILNAIVGFIQEFSAEKAVAGLSKISISHATVFRNEVPVTLPALDLVPGDVVLLKAGEMVPADLRLVDCHGLMLDESSLTGESIPVDKHPDRLGGEGHGLADRKNMAYKGSLVTKGDGRGIITATGMKTEIGRIAEMLRQEEPATPLQKRMTAFGKRLSLIILIICSILFITGILRGDDPVTMGLLAISLAVAAIPEALPALITVALSRGAARLARRKALIRKLPAVETLGSVSYICSDKTGTLTENRMKVSGVIDMEVPAGIDGYSMADLVMGLNHDALEDNDGGFQGDPTETAIIDHFRAQYPNDQLKKLEAELPLINRLPFDSDRKCMSTIHRFRNQFLVLTKGAIEHLGPVISQAADDGDLQNKAAEWASEGKRVLALAYRHMDSLSEPLVPGQIEKELRFCGLVSLVDPPRPGITDTIRDCRQAGIRPVMITGDHPGTALAIARKVGIAQKGDQVLTGPEIERMDDKTLADQSLSTLVYARVSPAQKLKIIRALQVRGQIVAMTGDGINDAPSLKAADIGVAMGLGGTDVSRQAADMILLDDNYSTILKAVEEGRRIFDNIRKFVKYIMTCNGAEIATIFLAPVLGMPLPLLPIQILWINLVTDGLPALALANEKAEEDVLERPPRPVDESLFSDGLGWHIIWVGLLMAGVTLGTQAWAIDQGMEHWQTMVFTVLSLSQLGHVMAVRGERSFLFRLGLFSNKPLILTVILTFALQMTVIYLPFCNTWFHTQPLNMAELGISVLLSLVVFHAVELEKFIKSRKGASVLSDNRDR